MLYRYRYIYTHLTLKKFPIYPVPTQRSRTATASDKITLRFGRKNRTLTGVFFHPKPCIGGSEPVLGPRIGPEPNPIKRQEN